MIKEALLGVVLEGHLTWLNFEVEQIYECHGIIIRVIVRLFNQVCTRLICSIHRSCSNRSLD